MPTTCLAATRSQSVVGRDHVRKVTDERLRSELAGVPRDEVRSGGYVLDTLRAAKWCFASTGSYRDCVLAAVNLGSDTDTTACVAGALAGTAYGMDAIPAEWLGSM